ncbi:COG5496 Predicted thioesterase [Candidatus Planktophila versatilis]|jgi:predicted thioesterase|uniref:Thioesterase n=1 Tax=Candidatus Planktophila versatilis TaxID=1884905 RepID=A0AAC9YUV0_9ACTN|nr:hotdog domain-containing protein [Candidatus Planktophila versatilis]ASY16826.1 putative thioesterase [Candidatus Planktophila versatilis]ASY18152.1 putative thioesterase [Candidatus Planktophila versatilis]ASY22171.1 putative thioesterase [Candidatus Planktophila versatilis]ASY25991.1 putative thioesterase [Candidatus Planktophila versatilis]
MKSADEVLGAVGFSVMTVRPGDTCVTMGVSDLPVVAPSHYLTLMENACVASLSEYLDSGETTFLTHSALEIVGSATAGAEIRANSRLIEIDGRQLTFTCDVYDGERHLAQAQIKRATVERLSFLARTAAQSLINE